MAESTPSGGKFSLDDLRNARRDGVPVPMLTCYDFTMAVLLHRAGVPAVLVGDSAATVVLGLPSTRGVSLPFMTALTAAVRRGHPTAFLVADMPFGSYHASTEQGTRNVLKLVARTECDAVKLEVADVHLPVIERAAAAGVAVIAHLGLRPQAAALLGGYRVQARSPTEQDELVAMARRCEAAGAAALLLEAVPSSAAQRVVDAVAVPVIGCGAGPACHGHVVVTPDLLGLTGQRPRFVPGDHDLTGTLLDAFRRWVEDVQARRYPAPQHQYGLTLNPAMGSTNPMRTGSPTLDTGRS